MSNRYFNMSNNDLMTSSLLASTRTPLNSETKVHDDTEEPKKIQGNIYLRHQIQQTQNIRNYQMEKERLQGLLRENRIPANRRGYYHQYKTNLEGKIEDEVKDLKNKE